MSLKFECAKCGQPVIVRFLKPGETARCGACAADNVVPESARETSEIAAPAVLPAAEPKSAVQPDRARPQVEIRRTDGQTDILPDLEVVRQAILDGKLPRTQEARLLVHDNKGQKTGKWTSVEKIANGNFRTQVLYRPVWAHTMRGLLIGWYIGFLLKALDSAVLYFKINPTMGLLWTVFAGAIAISLVTKVSQAWSVAFVVGLIAMFSHGGNLWMSALAVGLISFLVAAPLGMAAGTIVGRARYRSLPRAPDAVPEGTKPYVLGLAAPLVFAAAYIPLYLLWLNPLILSWVSGR